MESEKIETYATANQYQDLLSQNYLHSVKRLATPNTLILILYPLLMLFMETLFIKSPWILILLYFFYWGIIALLLYKRFQIERDQRGIACSARQYMLKSPASSTYLRIGSLTMMIMMAAIIGIVVPMTWYEAIVFLILLLLILTLIIFWGPMFRRMLKSARPVDSDYVLGRIRERCESAGIRPVVPQIVDGKEFKLANAYCIGILKPVICITDYLYENVSEDEAVALLSHELGHLMNRDGIKQIIPPIASVVLASILVLIISLASAGLVPIPRTNSTMLPLVEATVFTLLAGLTLPGAILKKRAERRADQFAVSFESPENLAFGIIKARYLNYIPLKYRGGGYPPVLKRVTDLENERRRGPGRIE